MTVQVIKLNVLNNKNEEEVIEATIKRLRVGQYTQVAKIIGGFVKRIREDEGLMQAIQAQFFGNFDEEWMDQETGQLMESVKREIEGNLIGALGFALEYLPEELVNLTSATANLHPNVVNNLDEESFFKVIESVIEVNDIERLKDLGKKHFDSIKDKLSQKANKQEQQANLQSVTQ